MATCPFGSGKKKCSKSCELFRTGFRYKDAGGKPEVVESCAINVACDCLENLVSRNIGLQQEMNRVRNASENVASIFEQALVAKKRESVPELDATPRIT